MDVTAQSVIVGVSAIVGTSLTTVVMSLIGSAQKRKDRKQQWERDDEVSKRVSEAAVLLVDSNAKVTANAKEVNGKLDTIHDLVNSNMTAQIEDSMMSKKREVIALKAVIELQKAQKIEPPDDALGIIKATEEQIAELQSRLNDRRKQQEVIDANKLTVTMSLPGKVGG